MMTTTMRQVIDQQCRHADHASLIEDVFDQWLGDGFNTISRPEEERDKYWSPYQNWLDAPMTYDDTDDPDDLDVVSVEEVNLIDQATLTPVDDFGDEKETYFPFNGWLYHDGDWWYVNTVSPDHVIDVVMGGHFPVVDNAMPRWKRRREQHTLAWQECGF